MESYIGISPVVLKLQPKKQANEMSDNLLEFLQTWSIIFDAMLLNQHLDRQKCIVISHVKSTAYINKYLYNQNIEH